MLDPGFPLLICPSLAVGVLPLGGEHVGLHPLLALLFVTEPPPCHLISGVESQYFLAMGDSLILEGVLVAPDSKLKLGIRRVERFGAPLRVFGDRAAQRRVILDLLGHRGDRAPVFAIAKLTEECRARPSLTGRSRSLFEDALWALGRKPAHLAPESELDVAGRIAAGLLARCLVSGSRSAGLSVPSPPPLSSRAK